MSVLDFIELVNENRKVWLQNTYEEYISNYDGKNSIDGIYNDYRIVTIDTFDDGDILLTIEK